MFNLLLVSFCNLIVVFNVNIFEDNYTQLSMDNYFLLVCYGIIVSFCIYTSFKKINKSKLGELNLILSLLSFIVPYTKTNNNLNNVHLFFALTSCLLATYLTLKSLYDHLLFKNLYFSIILIVISLAISLSSGKIIGLIELVISELIIYDLNKIKLFSDAKLTK